MEKTNNRQLAIINAKIFNGENIISATNIVIEDGKIKDIGGKIPEGAEILDAKGATLLPGLIDSHVHTSIESLRDALKFGVTTELEMMGGFTKKGRDLQLAGIDDISDVRSAGMALTAPGGHPDELMPGDGIPDFVLKEMENLSEEKKLAFIAAHEKQLSNKKDGPDVTTASGAIQFVQQQVRDGADYFKIMIEEGTVLNAPGLPVIKENILKIAVAEAHKHNKLAIAHVLTAEAAKIAMSVNVDGLAHLFIDRPDWTQDLVKLIAARKAFVIPCLVLNSSIIGNNASHFAHDQRVVTKLDDKWMKTMCSCFHTFPQGNMDDNFKNVIDLHKAGVDILVGTDVSVPVPSLGGLAHGASVHHEMQLLVQAGLTPIEALRAATSVPARRFGLKDRGRIFIGGRADFILVNGDPTKNISDSLSIIGVWKKGVRFFTN